MSYEEELLNGTITGNIRPSNYLPEDYDKYKDLNGSYDLLGGIAAHFKTSVGSNVWRNTKIEIAGLESDYDPDYNPLSDVSDPYLASRYWDEFYHLHNAEQVRLKEEQIRDNLSARRKIDTLNFGTQMLAYPLGNIAGGDISYFIPILKGGKILKTSEAFTKAALRTSGAEALYQIPKGWADPTSQESPIPGVSEEALFMIPTVGLFGGIMGAGLNALRGRARFKTEPDSSTPPPAPKQLKDDSDIIEMKQKEDGTFDVDPKNHWNKEKAGTLKHEIVDNGKSHKLRDVILLGNNKQQSTALVVLENQYQKDIANAITFRPEDSVTKWGEYKDTEWVFENGEMKEVHKVYTEGVAGRIVREIVERPFGLGRSPYDFTKDIVAKYHSKNNPVYSDSKVYNDALAELSYMMDDLVSDGALMLTTNTKAQGSGIQIQSRREFDRLIPKINEALYDGISMINGWTRGKLRAEAYDLGVERQKIESKVDKLAGGKGAKMKESDYYDLVIREIEEPGSTLRLGYDATTIQAIEGTARVINEITEMFEKQLTKRNLIGVPKQIQNEINLLEAKILREEKSKNPLSKIAVREYQAKLEDAKELLAIVKEENMPVRSGGYYPHLYREIPVDRKVEFIDDLEAQFKIDESLGMFTGKLTARERAEISAQRIMGEALEYNFGNLSGRGRSKYFIERQVTWHEKDKMLKWIDNDIFSVMSNYIHRVGPLIKMHDFGGGDIMLSKQMIEIEKNFNIIKSAAPKKYLPKIEEDMENFKLNIADMRDVVLGRMSNHGNPASIQARTARLLKNYATTLFAGKFLFSSIPDLGNMAAIIGMKEIGIYTQAITSGNKNLINAIEQNKEFTKEIGLAIETVLGSNARFMEPNQYRTPSGGLGQFGLRNMEDYAERGANAMHIANLLLPWTTMTKQLAGTLTTSQLIRNAIELTANVKPRANGKKYVADIPKKDIKEWQRLQNLGLSKSEIIAIGQKKTGVNWEKVEEGDTSIYVGNVNNWTDRKLAEKFEIAVFEQTELAVMIPGLSSKPNYLYNTVNVPFRGKWAVKIRKEMNDLDDKIRDGVNRGVGEKELEPMRERFRELQSEYSGLGRKYAPLFSLIFQFRSFGIGAAQKITQAFTQGRQRSRWSGLSAVIALAYISNYLRNPYYRFLDENEQMLTALEYTGVTNWLLDFNTSIETLAPLLTEDEFGLRAMLGMDPKWSYDENIDRVGGGFGTGYAALYKAYDYILNNDDKTDREKLNAIRQLIPFNNLFYLSPVAKGVQKEMLESKQLDDEFLYGY